MQHRAARFIIAALAILAFGVGTPSAQAASYIDTTLQGSQECASGDRGRMYITAFGPGQFQVNGIFRQSNTNSRAVGGATYWQVDRAGTYFVDLESTSNYRVHGERLSGRTTTVEPGRSSANGTRGLCYRPSGACCNYALTYPGDANTNCYTPSYWYNCTSLDGGSPEVDVDFAFGAAYTGVVGAGTETLGATIVQVPLPAIAAAGR